MAGSRQSKRALARALIQQKIDTVEQIGLLMGEYVKSYINRKPRKTNVQSGAEWVASVLQGNEEVCHENFRVEKHIFYMLCNKLVEHGLQRTINIGIEEMVAMFLYTVRHGLGNRIIQERFQHSGETVSRDFHRVLNACFNLATEIIKPVDPEFRACHPKILNDKRYHSYFENAIGAIDGTHIKCVVSTSEAPRFIGRKGYPTHNIMAVCYWDMCFTFVLAGWKGTAHDARVFNTALSTPHLNFPEPPDGKYYLVDSSYPTPFGYLGPYRRERYHLPDFRRQHGFSNHNEIFNYYHSSLRSTIEKTFGVWKMRFKMLDSMQPFDFPTQVRIVCVTMAIHNLIRRNSQTDEEFREREAGNITPDDDNDNRFQQRALSSTTSSPEMNCVRDTIRDLLVRDMIRN